MNIPPCQQEVARFLRSLSGLPPKETQISAVFIGRDTAWKLKKAVRLPFLDFTAIAERRRFLLRELELNRGAAPEIYRDVAAIVRGAGGELSLTADPGERPPLDWVLRMAPVPEHDFLDAIAARGDLAPELLDALGDCVAEYHAALPPRTDWDSPGALLRIAEGNERSARAAGLAAPSVASWFGDVCAAIEARREWLAERARSGFVRRGHGDLHLGNLCLWRGKPVPFDALEFDETLATEDLGYDLAFLLMDLDRRVHRAAANRVLNRYVARNGDAALTRGLPPFLSLRAMVRAHVQTATGRAEEGFGYLHAALAYLRPSPPMVVALGGLPGTGKSTLARRLASEIGAAPGALVLRSDEIRKRLGGVPPEQRLPEVAYDEAMNAKVNAALDGLAGSTAAGGHSVIADATFLDYSWRAAIETAANTAGAAFFGVWLHAPMPVLEARLAARVRDASDATVTVLHHAAAHERGPLHWPEVDASDAEPALAAVRRLLGLPDNRG